MKGEIISENAQYLDLGDGSMSVYTYQNLSNCTLRFMDFIVLTLVEKEFLNSSWCCYPGKMGPTGEPMLGEPACLRMKPARRKSHRMK